MPEDIQHKDQPFFKEKFTRKSNPLSIKRDRFADEFGMEGYDYSFVDVTVEKNGKKRSQRMFSKSIDRSKLDEDAGRVAPEIVLERYQQLKKLGLPVPPTLRISEDGNHILMTDMTQNGAFEILDRHSLLQEGITLNNLEGIKSQLIQISKIAAENEIVFSLDAYAILVDRETHEGSVALLDLGSGIRSQSVIEKMFTQSGQANYQEFLIQQAINSARDFGELLELLS